jgi:type II secretory ATPase GspE/PulE/Tfp pilus assembly ATPase PilB-like protein
MKPYGCILVSGPTGSGKTTTLYSILKIINSREKNITTVEDPVEYEIEGVNQVQINTKAELTFARGLRSILRQDPDIIMIGEIRDAETAEIAINSAMTGHLVLSTIHTNDAITTVPRLIEMGVDPYLVANTINTVIAQRLARKLCDKCKKKKVLAQTDLDELGVYRPDIVTILKAGDTVYEEVGCESCTNGFKGRVGLYEVLEINESLRNLILERKSSDEIFKIARENKFVLILEDGVDKIRKGLISLNELVRVTALRE